MDGRAELDLYHINQMMGSVSNPGAARTIQYTPSEVLDEDGMFPVSVGIGAVRTDPSYQSCDPVGRLNGLVPIALYLEWWFKELPAWLSAPKHTLSRCRDDLRTLAVLVEDEDKLACRGAVFLAELIDSLDRFHEDQPIQLAARESSFFWSPLLDPDVENKAAEVGYLGKQSVGLAF